MEIHSRRAKTPNVTCPGALFWFPGNFWVFLFFRDIEQVAYVINYLLFQFTSSYSSVSALTVCSAWICYHKIS